MEASTEISDKDILAFIAANIQNETALVSYLSTIDKIPNDIINVTFPNYEHGNILHAMIKFQPLQALSTFQLVFSKLDKETIQALMLIPCIEDYITPFPLIFFMDFSPHYNRKHQKQIFIEFLKHISDKTLNAIFQTRFPWGENTMFMCFIQKPIPNKVLETLLQRVDKSIMMHIFTTQQDGFSYLMHKFIFNNDHVNIKLIIMFLNYIEIDNLMPMLENNFCERSVVSKGIRPTVMTAPLTYIRKRNSIIFNEIVKRVLDSNYDLTLSYGDISTLDADNQKRFFARKPGVMENILQTKATSFRLLKQKKFKILTAFQDKLLLTKHHLQDEIAFSKNVYITLMDCFFSLESLVDIIRAYLIESTEPASVTSRNTIEIKKENHPEKLLQLKSLYHHLREYFLYVDLPTNVDPLKYKHNEVQIILQYCENDADMTLAATNDSENTLKILSLNANTRKNKVLTPIVAMLGSAKALLFSGNTKMINMKKVHDAHKNLELAKKELEKRSTLDYLTLCKLNEKISNANVEYITILINQIVQAWINKKEGGFNFFQAVLEQTALNDLVLADDTEHLNAMLNEYIVDHLKIFQNFFNKHEFLIHQFISGNTSNHQWVDNLVTTVMSRAFNVTLIILYEKSEPFIIKRQDPIGVLYLGHNATGYYSAQPLQIIHESPIDNVNAVYTLDPKNDPIGEVLATLEILMTLAENVHDNKDEMEAKMSLITDLAKTMKFDDTALKIIKQKMNVFETKFSTCEDNRTRGIIDSLLIKLRQVFSLELEPRKFKFRIK